MTDPIRSDAMERASVAALCGILRDNSLWEVIRIVCSARWGSLGRTLEEKRAAPSQEGTPNGDPTSGIADDLRRMMDSLVAMELRRDELPEWVSHVSEYVDRDKVYVMDPNHRPPMLGLPWPKAAPDPLWVVAARPLTEQEQEAAVRLFVAKRDRTATAAPREEPPRE